MLHFFSTDLKINTHFVHLQIKYLSKAEHNLDWSSNFGQNSWQKSWLWMDTK